MEELEETVPAESDSEELEETVPGAVENMDPNIGAMVSILSLYSLQYFFNILCRIF